MRLCYIATNNKREITPALPLAKDDSHQRLLQAMSACSQYCGVHLSLSCRVALFALQYSYAQDVGC
jgi:hypothetical protein